MLKNDPISPRTPNPRPVKHAIRTLVLAVALAAGLTSSHAATLGKSRFRWAAVDHPSVTGYKVHWGTQSGVYSRSVDAGNTTEIIIQEFSEGVEYFSAVTAYSATGEESDFSPETTFTYDSVDRIILLEAENGAINGSMQVSGDGATSWVSATMPDSASTATLEFSVPYQAAFYVWCRVLAPTDSQDSIFVAVDQQPEHVYHIYGQDSPPMEAFKTDWVWSRIELSPGVPLAYSLDSGSHTIRFRYLEDVKIDRVVVVSNPDFVPTDSLPRTGDFVEVLAHPQNTTLAAGDSTALSAAFVSTGPVSLQWYHDGEAIPNASNSVLDLNEVKPADAGEYRVAASQRSVSAMTNPATLNVLPATSNEVFRVRKLSITGGGQVTFEIVGAVGSEIGVFASSDLVNWSLLSTHPNTGGTLTINDPASFGAARRFYRLSDTVAK
jgi:hypothetical protein